MFVSGVGGNPELDSPAVRLGSSVPSRHAMSPAPGVADRGHIEHVSGLSSDGSSLALTQQSPAPVQRPQTRLNQGIRRPRVYTDNAIWYVMLSTTGDHLVLMMPLMILIGRKPWMLSLMP
jgi:hypothetical protein